MKPANSFEPSQVLYSWIRPACDTSCFSSMKTFLFDEIGEGEAVIVLYRKLTSC